MDSLDIQKQFNALYARLSFHPRTATRHQWIRCCRLYYQMNEARMKEGRSTLVLSNMEKRMKNLGLRFEPTIK